MHTIRRRICASLIAVVLFAAVFLGGIPVAQAAWSGGVEISDWYGDGSAVDYVISTEDELAGLAAIVNGTATPLDGFTGQDSFSGKTITLGADLDLAGQNWTPIGLGNSFEGAFDGGSHIISNLTIGSAGTPDATLTRLGLFGLVTVNSTITDLTMVGTAIYSSLGTTDNFAYMGALAGISSARIERCQSSGVLSGGYKSTVGGLVGLCGDFSNIGIIVDCGSSCTVTSGDGASNAGGLIGYTDNADVSGSTATGLVTCGSADGSNGDPDAGGFAGAFNGTAADSTATGNVSGGNDSYVGGFIGSNYGAISDCTASGAVSAGNNAHAGGFMGLHGSSSDDLSGCEATGNVSIGDAVSDYAYVGGFMGKSSNSNVTGCIARGAVTGGEARAEATIGETTGIQAALYAGGFAGCIEGYISASHTVNNCFAYGNVSAEGASFSGCTDSSCYVDAGGFVGYSRAGNIEQCAALGDTTSAGSFVLSGSGNTGGVYAGGFAGIAFGTQRPGYVRNGIIINCYARGQATGQDGANIGGFAGGCIADDDMYSIEYIAFELILNSYTTTDTISTNCANVGGFVGELQNANIINSYTAGSLSGSADNIGGFAGYIGSYDSDNLLANTYYNSGTADSFLESDAVGENTSGLTILTQGLRGTLMRGEVTGSIGYDDGDTSSEASTFLEALNGGNGLVRN